MTISRTQAILLGGGNAVVTDDEGKLFERLLSFGGERVVALPEEDVKKLLKRGKLWKTKAIFFPPRDARPSRCHQNAAALWEANRDIVKIVTGWALSPDGMWRQHSWGLNGRKTVETTSEPRTMYYGYILTPKESELFLHENE